MMRQLLGWGVALIAMGLILGLLAITDVIVAAFLPWIAGTLLIVGIIMTIASAATPPERREARV